MIDLELENERLRGQLRVLAKELDAAKERHTLVLPNAQGAKSHRMWSVPLRIGDEFAPRTFDPHGVPHHRSIYVLNFVLSWEHDGAPFWRVLPFSTEPER